MAKRKRDQQPGHGRMLDAWAPPSDAGEPIGCLATSFTFAPAFFEEECLGRFLHLESDPNADGAVYLIEREERLAQLRCAAALVDQHHCRGFRSLRWDLLCVRPAAGLLHAKVSLLQWTRCLRLIVGSANLSEDGYRRNREVFGVLDYHDGCQAPRACLEQLLDFLEQVVNQTSGGEGDDPPADRCRSLIAGARDVARRWSQPEPRSARSTVVAVTTGPEQPSALESAALAWPVRRRPHTAAVASPFFDPPIDGADRPAQTLWGLLRRRGQIAVHYHITAEEVAGESAVLVHAPESMLRAEPLGRPSAETVVYRLPDEPNRPFHAKALWLEGDNWVGSMIGSSNFTTAGLGVGRAPNLEANLLYLAGPNDAPAEEALARAFPTGEPVPDDYDLRWQPVTDEDSPDQEVVLLPTAFDSARYARNTSGEPVIRLRFTDRPPAGWTLSINDTDEHFYDDATWQRDGTPRETDLPWPEDRLPPYGFTVRWTGSAGGAWWPVNIQDTASLPPPQELRDLPLEVLIEVLTSARPLHQALRRHLTRLQRERGPEKPVVDPHERVDTGAFVLQRTRRVAWALRGLRERLERPVATQQSLHWRLYGPVGVEALAKALAKEAHSYEERAFLLTELALEVGRVRPHRHEGALPPRVVRDQLRAAAECVRQRIPFEAMPTDSNLRHYIDEAFQQITV